MTTERICRTCRHATTEPGHTAHYKARLRNCEHLPAWHFVGPMHTCEKWQAKEQEEPPAAH